MKDYMLPVHSYPVEFSLIEVHYGLDTKLCDPSMEGLVKSLRYTYENLREALSKGKKASKFVCGAFDHRTMGKRMLELLEKIVRREGL